MDKSSISCCDDGILDQEKPSDSKSGSQSTSDFSERTWKEDFTLLVEGEKLYVSKAVLALSSPVFDQMFQSDFKEKNQTELNLPGKNVSEVRDFLRSIYPCMHVCISEGNVYKLLSLAEEYQVSSLKANCEKFLIRRLNSELPADELKTMMQTAVIFNMEDLLNKLYEEIPEECAKDVILEKHILPSESSPKILAKIMERLEQVREQKTWLESIYKFSTSGGSRAEKRTIENFHGCKYQILNLELNVNDLKRNRKQTKQFKLLDCDKHCSISIYYGIDNLLVEITFDRKESRQENVKFYGRLVIRNVTDENEDYKHTFDMEFNPSEFKKTTNMNIASAFFDVKAGYIYFYNMDAEVHLLTKMHKEEY